MTHPTSKLHKMAALSPIRLARSTTGGVSSSVVVVFAVVSAVVYATRDKAQ